MRRTAIAFVIVVVLLSVNLGAGFASGLGLSSPASTPAASDSYALTPSVRADALPDGPTHDLAVTASNVTSLAGMPVSFRAAISGVAPATTTWWWGDGTTSTVTTNPVTHTYANPGIYLIYAQGTDSTGNVHDNLYSLLRFAVLDSFAADALGNEVQIQGSIVANSSTTSSAQAVLTPGGWVQVSNWVTNLPTDPQWALESPSYSVGATAEQYVNISTILGSGLNLSGATLSWSNTTPQGSYTLNFSFPDANDFVSPSNVTLNNFTFTIFVSASASTPVLPVPSSPHNGTLEVYQVYASGSQNMTLDPALADDPTDGPILQNIYQTLIVYNGSHAGPDPSDFVPDLATCVPGSVQCESLYGSSLVSGDNWTFVINPNATFYNGTTGGSWSVFPNDVAFSFARSCALANSVGPEGLENFVLCQALLPSNGNSSWDGGVHAPWNNTPAQILSAMTVNSSLYCTSLMKDGVHGNGCITLDTAASGQAWPEFLEFVESTSGWAVTRCSWAASEGLGLPGWTNGSTCYPAPPGSPGNSNPVPGATAWDGYIIAEGSFGSVPTTALRYHALGSGPYYLVSFDNTSGYTLRASPVWGGTTCRGGRLQGCLPDATKGGVPPSYIPNVVVQFESSNGPGLAAMAAGNADLIDTSGGGGNAGYGGNGTTILSEVRAGELDYIVGPAVTEWWGVTEMQFNVSAASDMLGAAVTLPADAFQDVNFRQFLVASFPHLSEMASNCIISGILYCFTTGGAIPLGMGDYYPTNISWPIANPNTDPLDTGGAAWWWSQVASDSMVGVACTSATPCTFPMPAVAGQTAWYDAWADAMRNISNGAIQPTISTVAFSTMEDSTVFAAPGNASFPTAEAGWAPDYFDPSDYANPAYLPTVYYGSFLGFQSILEQSQYQATCAGPASDPTVSTSCQGTAYAELVSLVQSADNCALPSCSQSERALLYNMAERIADALGLYVNLDQQAAVYAFAPWIGASSLLLNPDRNNVYGGTTSDQPFFMIQYATSIPQGYTLGVALGTPGVSPTLSGSPTPLVSSVRPGAGTLTLEAGETFLTLVSVTGGTGVYHYIWNGLPTGCTSLSTAVLACRPTAGGNVSMVVTVIDSAGDVGVSSPLPVGVIPHLSIASFSAIPSTVVLGKSVSLSLSTMGGITPIAYAYVGLPAGCLSSDATSLLCTPTATGHYSITATASDSVGIVAVASVELNVTAKVVPTPTGFLGLAGNEGYYVVGAVLLAVVAIAALVIIGRRRSRSSSNHPSGGPADERTGPPSGTTRATGSLAGPATVSASTPAASTPKSVETGPSTTIPGKAPTRVNEGTASGPVVCPSCGAENRRGARYCDQCSAALPA
jgi:hypothetical protein